MGTSTRSITGKIHARLTAEFLPVAEAMRAEGCDDRDIVRALNSWLGQKRTQQERKTSDAFHISSCLTVVLKRDSKTEGRFYFLLEQSGLKFSFQYEIPPYRVDFLVEDFIALELDGLQHRTEEAQKHDERRDKYLRLLGYTVLRVPVAVADVAADAVIEEIRAIVEDRQERLKRFRVVRGGKKRRAECGQRSAAGNA
ncbi:MAG: DUF559 domain-containing protein [Desulfobacterales bacterium]